MTDEQEQILTRDEVLVLLSEKTRDGSTSAMVALERALRLHRPEVTSWTPSSTGFSNRATEAVVTGAPPVCSLEGWTEASPLPD
ncbi:MAG TPA: hypothetical protein VF052_07825 [Solirubrobacterales bacterium]